MKTQIFLKNTGFTIIELIVVFTALAILSAIGIASFASYSKSQVLVQDTSNIISLINKAKSSAMSQVKLSSVCSTPGQSLQGYIVVINYTPVNNEYTYSMKGHCSNPEQIYEISSENYKLSNKVKFEDSSTIVKIEFPILIGAIVLKNGLSSVIDHGTITLSGAGASKTINIDKNGVISVN